MLQPAVTMQKVEVYMRLQDTINLRRSGNWSNGPWSSGVLHAPTSPVEAAKDPRAKKLTIAAERRLLIQLSRKPSATLLEAHPYVSFHACLGNVTCWESTPLTCLQSSEMRADSRAILVVSCLVHSNHGAM